MANPIKWWKSDPDYYPKKDPRRKDHLQRIKENKYIDSLINIASSDSSYAVVIKKCLLPK